MKSTEHELLRGFIGPRFTRNGPINIEDLARLQRALKRRHGFFGAPSVTMLFFATFHYQPTTEDQEMTKRTRFDALADELFQTEPETLTEIALKTASSIIENGGSRAQRFKSTQVYLVVNGNIVGRVEELATRESQCGTRIDDVVLATPWKIEATFVMQVRLDFRKLQSSEVVLIIYHDDDSDPMVYRLDVVHVDMMMNNANQVTSRVRANACSL